MATTATEAPAGGLERGKQQRLLELEQALVQALKEQRFQQALKAAETILQLDPKNVRAKEFVPLLQEKLSLDEDDSESDGDDDSTAAGDQNVGDADEGQGSGDDEGTSTSDDEDDDEDDSSESEEEEQDEQDGVQQNGTQATSLSHEGAAAGADGEASDIVGVLTQELEAIRLDTRGCLTSAQRLRIKRQLAESVKRLKDTEEMQKLAEADPLLGA